MPSLTLIVWFCAVQLFFDGLEKFYDCFIGEWHLILEFFSSNSEKFLSSTRTTLHVILLVIYCSAGRCLYQSWVKGGNRLELVISHKPKKTLEREKMYVWLLIFWIIYNPAALFLTMQWSLIIKNSWLGNNFRCIAKTFSFTPIVFPASKDCC